jgi:hypothetical protein
MTSPTSPGGFTPVTTVPDLQIDAANASAATAALALAKDGATIHGMFGLSAQDVADIVACMRGGK